MTREETLPAGCADPADNIIASSPSLLKAPWLWDLQLCVSHLVKTPREFPEFIHTHPRSSRVKKFGFADARVASEKVLGTLTQLVKVFYILFTQLWNF